MRTHVRNKSSNPSKNLGLIMVLAVAALAGIADIGVRASTCGRRRSGIRPT